MGKICKINKTWYDHGYHKTISVNCDAEVYAIYKACTLTEENAFSRSVILANSRSALQKISSKNIFSKKDYWTFKTRQKILLG